ncbi:DUF397 domain-containing protein [Plantactinospora sp. BB1]|uniref:DUF397 domain-containing protein n=1 Tax=Plantactinospora sp. BB1 TaxID=2071627 RepID=UPI000D160E95|nr:DUF397 domain-containing protein [Plantactinospora sp. BB1]AVT41369.1 DUF397 domain-containing protein [Plantactinospora sp. BB1]
MIDLCRADWRKSSRSGGGNCVEVADNLVGVVGVRDSKDVTGPVLAFPPHAWAAFVAAVAGGAAPTPDR